MKISSLLLQRAAAKGLTLA
jgi:hypothetical protein